MQNYNLPIIIEKNEDGYIAYCPELQGCYTQGDTYEEALANIKDAIALHIQDRVENGESVSRPEVLNIATVEVAV
ncbi:type II toxin-antitoxin system HicB family antitoxin [candidate division WOR-3 bacterium]|uniref:Type II toxin-antitoxin system HicB family antitoxin n=1 Tax=candidate division WOR-3 bacterium TaxID=2052148 RepID=A0A937XIA0_UNCW3|nr:type II toxin-antitoxin system HicB family antitoxin [candidate division WOR-3 bacterium]